MSQLRSGVEVPSSPFPVLPLRTGVLFPGTMITLPVGRERSLALVDTLSSGSVIGVIAQKDPKIVDPTASDLHSIGTFARVHQVQRTGPKEYRLVLAGIGRFQFRGFARTEPFWLADGEFLEDKVTDYISTRNAAKIVREAVQDLLASSGNAGTVTPTEDDPSLFADQVAGALELPTEKEIRVLAEVNVLERLRIVAELVSESRATADVRRKIDSEVRKEFGKHQREALLREQLRAIQRELGEDRSDDALGKLKEKLLKADLPQEVREVADRELRRLEGVPGQQAEHNVIRNYLEWIADLPWNVRSEAMFDLDKVSQKLDEDHHGLEDIKKRILEHIAVLKLSGNAKGNILCFAGPPGVGKTSLGQSIADATGRPFVRIALGGVRDEAEVRGHRRTYVGALPGRLVHALRKAKVKNPVILLDEIDKLGTGWNGSPEAALLEVLDPEQNKNFTDHYLEMPFDLSEVLFICTANTLETLSAPLRDRLEIIELAGYTPDEKVHIAKKHLIPKQLREHAIHDGALVVSDNALKAIVRDYTREAGVRQLNREITKLCRAVALEVAKEKDGKVRTLQLSDEELSKYLGKVKFFSEIAERTSVPGVATGLAWTPVGGDILFIETSRMPGKGHVEITGQLGDVMKESARAALSYVRSNAQTLGVDPAFLAAQDVHIHVPAGAVPKDGPSAGVTMFTALTSLLTGRKVRNDTAMTGECTLRGRVLPVGGIKAKVMAAHRAGITRVILPSRNARDVEDVPAETRSALEFFFADDMSQVLAAALETNPSPVSTLSSESASAQDPIRPVV